MKRKLKKRSPSQKQKKATDDWCSRYIRIRDSIACGGNGEWGKCYTCGKIVLLPRADSGHFKSRGMGGSSGIYFDERAIHLQCKRCNGFEQGRPTEYKEHLIEDQERLHKQDYNELTGEELIDVLELKHRVNSYDLMELTGLELYFKNRVLAWCDEYKIVKWWE